jgi:hypothetical protein
MANVAASANVVVSPVLLTWGTSGVGQGAYAAIDFYTVDQKTLWVATITSQNWVNQSPASWDLGLLDVNGNELAGNGYSRVNVNFAQQAWVKTGPTSVANGSAITYGAATAAWTGVYSLAIYNHATGKLLQAASMTSPPINVASVQHAAVQSKCSDVESADIETDRGGPSKAAARDIREMACIDREKLI